MSTTSSRKLSGSVKSLFAVACIWGMPVGANAGSIITNYQTTFNGSVTTITNLSSSNSAVDFTTLNGANAGDLFAVDPGNSATISASGGISGDFYAVDYCADCALAVTEGSTVITAFEDGVTWKDKTTGETGTLDTGQQKTFPNSHTVTTTGTVRRGIDFDMTTSTTTVTWNLESLPAGLRPGIVTAQLVSGSVTSYDTNTITNLVTGNVAVGALDCPEPATWATMILGFAGLGVAGFYKARRTRMASCGIQASADRQTPERRFAI